LPEGRKESLIIPIYKKGEKTDCSNYRGISLLPTTYKIISNILLSKLTPYAEEVIGDHQCGFGRNRSTTDHTVCPTRYRTRHFFNNPKFEEEYVRCVRNEEECFRSVCL
jgi:hypothetical protein